MELCRCCLLEGNIGLDSLTDENIIEILEFLGVIFKIKNNFPKNICNSCDLKLKEFVDFRQQCLQTEITLKDLFQTPDFIKKEGSCENVLPNLQENNTGGPQRRRSKRLTKNLELPKFCHQYGEVKKEDKCEDIPPNREDSHKTSGEECQNRRLQKEMKVPKLQQFDKEAKKEKTNKLESFNNDGFLELHRTEGDLSKSEPFEINNQPNDSDRSNKDSNDEISDSDNFENDSLESEVWNPKPKFFFKRPSKILTRTYNPRIKHNFPLRCHICNRGFIYQELLDGHLREHDGKNIAICEFCSNEYSSWNGLRQHIKKCHLAETKYHCDCGKLYLFESSFETHRASHYGKQGHICETCGKSFPDQCDLKRHSLIHTDERPFRCKTCEKAFKSEKNLRAHEFRHTGIRKFACEVCGKPFVSRPELKTHMLVHTSEKAYKCKLCEKDFRYKNQLDVHKTNFHALC